MHYAHPLYRVPLDYPDTRRLFVDDSTCLRTQDPASGNLLVYATSLNPDRIVAEGDDENVAYIHTLGEFAPEYTPTAEEVVRALRGPEGAPGPMGPRGMST